MAFEYQMLSDIRRQIYTEIQRREESGLLSSKNIIDTEYMILSTIINGLSTDRDRLYENYYYTAPEDPKVVLALKEAKEIMERMNQNDK